MDNPPRIQKGQLRRYGCVICQDQGLPRNRFATPRGLKRHIFSFHQYAKNFTVTCGINGRAVRTNQLRYLNNHLRIQWTPDYATVYLEQSALCLGADVQDLDEDPPGSGTYRYEMTFDQDQQDNPASSGDTSLRPTPGRLNLPESTDPECLDEEDDDIVLYDEEMGKSNYQRRKEICISLARLRSQNTMTEVCFEHVKDWITVLLTNLAHVMIDGMKKHSALGNTDNINHVTEFGLGIADPFHGLSEHNFLKVLQDDLGYVNPETVILAEAPSPSQSGIEHRSMQYIPMLSVLYMLLQDKDLLKRLHQDHTQRGFLRDFCDGEYSKRHPLFEKPGSLQIQLYYDDFEFANPLGSKAGVHKIGKIMHVSTKGNNVQTGVLQIGI